MDEWVDRAVCLCLSVRYATVTPFRAASGPDFGTSTPSGFPAFPGFPGSSAPRTVGAVSRLFPGDGVAAGGVILPGSRATVVHVDDSFVTDGTSASGDHTPSSAFVTPESFAAAHHGAGDRSFGEISGIDLSGLSSDGTGRSAVAPAGAGAGDTPVSGGADASMDLETSQTFSP